jgi:hypothetical protein
MSSKKLVQSHLRRIVFELWASFLSILIARRDQLFESDVIVMNVLVFSIDIRIQKWKNRIEG